MYSYAIHLRKGSYRSLPFSRAVHTTHSTSHTTYDALPPEDDDIEDFYRIPLRSPFSWNNRPGSSGNQSAPATFPDFVSPPGRQPRKKGGGSNSKENGVNGELLFDGDETTQGASSPTLNIGWELIVRSFQVTKSVQLGTVDNRPVNQKLHAISIPAHSMRC